MGRFMLANAGPPPARKPIAPKRYGLGNLEVTIEFGDESRSVSEVRAIECFLRLGLLKVGHYGP